MFSAFPGLAISMVLMTNGSDKLNKSREIKDKIIRGHLQT